MQQQAAGSAHFPQPCLLLLHPLSAGAGMEAWKLGALRLGAWKLGQCRVPSYPQESHVTAALQQHAGCTPGVFPTGGRRHFNITAFLLVMLRGGQDRIAA